MIALLSLLVGCAPVPASITFDGGPNVTVHKMDTVDVLKASVLDAEKHAIEPQPVAVWTVGPDTVATLVGNKLTPVADGIATITATVGTVKGSYTFTVALPNKIEIAGYDAAAPVGIGATATLTGTVMAGADKIEGETVAWTSSKPEFATVDAAGLVTGVADGVTTITASSGNLAQTLDIAVGTAAIAAVAPDAPAVP